MTDIAATKLAQRYHKENIEGVLLKDTTNGKYRVMDKWGRFWTIPSPEK